MRVSIATEMLKRIKVTVEDRGYPLCFDSRDQYLRWQQMERLCPTQPIRNFICEDCKPEFKTQMMFQKRCSNISHEVKEDD